MSTPKSNGNDPDSSGITSPAGPIFRFLQTLDIQQKLRWIIMVTSSAALLLACVAFVIYDLYQIRGSLVTDMRTLSTMIGNLTTAALKFDDANTARESLGALQNRKHIVTACIFGKDGAVFASYVRPGLKAPPVPTLERHGERFGKNRFESFAPIHLEGELLGTVYVQADLEEMHLRVRQYVLIVAVVMLLSSAVALLLSSPLQRLISRPIIDLAVISRRVSTQKDYSVRAVKQGQDEIGHLIDAFNEMLGQIQSRDAALQQAHDDLEQRVEERTRELQQAIEKLSSFAARLENSNRELQDFAYVASHDLQEPLRKVQAFGDRLKQKYGEVIGVDGKDFLERMQSAARRMQNLIDDLLSFSRVTTKASPFKQVDLNKIAQEVMSDLEVRIQQTGGQIQAGVLPVIEADSVQMRQLLQNLIGNALKFHKPDGKPMVTISARILAPNETPAAGPPRSEPMCELSITDNGIGFDEKYLDRIFAVFQRLHSRAAYEGTGIGLAICRKIAERHGGTITARSKEGEGASFIVTMPMAQTKDVFYA